MLFFWFFLLKNVIFGQRIQKKGDRCVVVWATGMSDGPKNCKNVLESSRQKLKFSDFFCKKRVFGPKILGLRDHDPVASVTGATRGLKISEKMYLIRVTEIFWKNILIFFSSKTIFLAKSGQKLKKISESIQNILKRILKRRSRRKFFTCQLNVPWN